jgi:PAS domain-containing protein
MWSPQTFRLMDLEPDAIVPTYPIFLSLVHPDDRDGLDAAVHAALREQRPCDLDCRIVVRNGVSRVCHVSGSVQRGATGEPLRMLGTIQDVTERKQIEDELRLTKERYDFATSVGKVGTWDWKPTTGVLVWSTETFRLMGFEPDAVVPSYELYLGLVHPEDRAMLAAAVDAALYDRRPYDLDCRIVLGNGARLVCHVTGHVEFDPEGKPIRMLGTIQDVTERKRIEDELRLTKERYDFATVVGKVGVWDWNPVTGDLAWSSETFQLLGFVPDSIVPTYELYLGLVHLGLIHSRGHFPRGGYCVQDGNQARRPAGPAGEASEVQRRVQGRRHAAGARREQDHRPGGARPRRDGVGAAHLGDPGARQP